ncbi:Dehydrogenase [Lachnellula hyalina]|uniref:Dehydrogenase n=1 Tax=Lachnellula hyalina TaxID=1316788 RepID=A0A8H8QZE3_9HELO|nr:Dehydrogenase [Lachnellula hyalina]TVY25697.1 Dehydrogenase [Lachnellula hyalina]
MSTQNALALTELGKPLTKITLPIPSSSELKDNEVLIKITAAGLAPLDQKLRDKNMFNIGSRLPAIFSGDLVGTVVSNGAKAKFPIGAHVFSQTLFDNPRGGGLQEYTIINGEYAAVVPDDVSDEEAALYPINAVTAAWSLFSSGGFDMPFPETAEAGAFDYAGQKIAIVGGGSNLGKLATQFAAFAGVGTVIAIASPDGAELLKSFGATHVISRHDTNIEEQVRGIVGDELLHVFDTINMGEGHTLGVSLLSDSKKGVFVSALPGKATEAMLAKKKGGIEEKFIRGFSHSFPDVAELFWKEFPTWLAKGSIRPLKFKVIEGLDADKVNHALDEYAAGRSGERYHVRVSR